MKYVLIVLCSIFVLNASVSYADSGPTKIVVTNPPKIKYVNVNYKGIPNKVPGVVSSASSNYLHRGSKHIVNLIRVLKYINAHYVSGSYPVIKLNNGEFLYPYSSSIPTVLVSPGHLTLIRLPKGTKVLDLVWGDKAAFKVKKVRGVYSDHVIVEPGIVNMHVSLVIITNVKTYYIRLISDKLKYVPIVGFYFPGMVIEKFKSAKVKLGKTLVSTNPISVGALSFKYYEEGSKIFNVERVFNDGKETFIKIGSLNGRPLPTVLLVQGGKSYLANFLYRNHYFILRSKPKHFEFLLDLNGKKHILNIYRGVKPVSHWW